MSLVRRFQAAHKKQLIRLTGWVLMGLVIFFGGAALLRMASDNRTMLAAVVLMLIGFESTVLVKLWYWTVDGRLRIQEEIKRLEAIMASEAPGEDAGRMATNAGDGSRGALLERIAPKSLRRLCTATVMITACAGGILILGPLFIPRKGDAIYKSECHATLAEDGSAKVTGRMRYTNYGVAPTNTVEIRPEEQLTGLTCVDAQGNALACKDVSGGGEFRYEITLTHPLFREEAVDLRLNWTSPDMARQQDGVWVFTARVRGPWRKGLWPYMGTTWFRKGKMSSAYLDTSSTVALPEGASFESATPRRFASWIQDGRMMVYFPELNKIPQSETLQVTYRLNRQPRGDGVDNAGGAK